MITNSILDLITVPWVTCVLFAAVRHRTFTILSNQTMTAKEIASKCGAIPHLLTPLLNACVSLGLLQSNNNVYSNTHFSAEYLVDGEPHYVGDLIELQHLEFSQWEQLADIIAHRQKSDQAKPPEAMNYSTFIKAMNNLGMLGEAEALKNQVDLSGCKEMVDAGGGSGLYSVMLCQKFQGLRSTILDVKETLAITEKMISTYPEKNRINLREADITKDPFGNNIDAVLLSDVIYDELTAMPVLRNAWNCLHPDGILIIRGYYSDPEMTKPLFGALFVLNQIVFDPERTIMTISTLQENVTKTGFTLIKTSPLTDRSFIIIAKK